EEARGWITARLGREYVPDTAPTYRSRGSAQEAHEAVRPSEVRFEPRNVERFLTRDQQVLYRLIWERFMASQMMPAVYDTVSADRPRTPRSSARSSTTAATCVVSGRRSFPRSSASR